jgi:hypothetical protein
MRKHLCGFLANEAPGHSGAQSGLDSLQDEGKPPISHRQEISSQVHNSRKSHRFCSRGSDLHACMALMKKKDKKGGTTLSQLVQPCKLLGYSGVPGTRKQTILAPKKTPRVFVGHLYHIVREVSLCLLCDYVMCKWIHHSPPSNYTLASGVCLPRDPSFRPYRPTDILHEHCG